MTFNDIFKSSFLENVTSISMLDMGIALGLALCIGLDGDKTPVDTSELDLSKMNYGGGMMGGMPGGKK